MDARHSSRQRAWTVAWGAFTPPLWRCRRIHGLLLSSLSANTSDPSGRPGVDFDLNGRPAIVERQHRRRRETASFSAGEVPRLFPFARDFGTSSDSEAT